MQSNRNPTPFGMRKRRTSALAGKNPAKTSCAEVRELWAGYLDARAAGKRTYRLKKLSEWRAKWEPRYQACMTQDEDLAEQQDVIDQLQDQAGNLLESVQDTTTTIADWTQQNMLYIGIAFVVLLGLAALAYFYMQRSEADDAAGAGLLTEAL